VPVRGTEKHALAQAEQVGAVHPDELIEVTVRVRSRADAALPAHIDQLAAQAPDKREHLSREQFAERFGADPADLPKVEAFAGQRGLAVVSSSAARRSVVLGGTAAQMTAAFGVTLHLFAHPNGGTYRGREGAVFVPSELADVVQGVFGLDDRPAARPHFRLLDELAKAQALAAAQASFTPPQIGQLY